jgi:hypothetical protein
MNASDILKGLIQLGVAVKDAASKTSTGGAVDWGQVAKDLGKDPAVAKSVKDLINALGSDDVKNAIGEVDAKQKAILKGRAISQLAHDELLQYSDLADARLLLATQQLTSAMSAGVLQWLVNDALPTLIDIVPVVLPLLL